MEDKLSIVNEKSTELTSNLFGSLSKPNVLVLS